MKLCTAQYIIAVLATIALGFAVAYNLPAPFVFREKIPGWIFWGVGFVIQLKHIAFMGIPNPYKTNEIDFFELYIGMNEDDFR